MHTRDIAPIRTRIHRQTRIMIIIRVTKSNQLNKMNQSALLLFPGNTLYGIQVRDSEKLFTFISSFVEKKQWMLTMPSNAGEDVELTASQVIEVKEQADRYGTSNFIAVCL